MSLLSTALCVLPLVDCNNNGIDDALDLAAGTSTDLNGNGVPDECESVVYVDAAATGNDDGTSWQDAYVELQSALTYALPGDFVWVAAGTYRPDFDVVSGLHDGMRVRSFALPSGVKVLGGFQGGETSIAQRDPVAYPAVLSGDIGVSGDPSDDSYHVVTGTVLDAQTLLDGFEVELGNADGPVGSTFDVGAGMFLIDTWVVVRRCTFTSHRAREGGAVWARLGGPSFVECRFASNTVQFGGGGLYLRQATAALVSCDLDGNGAWRGAAIEAHECALDVHQCRIAFNQSADGPALYQWKTASNLRCCTFARNTSVAPCAAAIVAKGTSVDMRDSIVWNNGYFVGPTLVPSNIWTGSGTVLKTHYSITQGCGSWCSGVAVVDADPLFADELSGDFRLRPGSPAIDAAQNGQVPADVFDLDGDGDLVEKLPIDLDGDPRRVDEADSPDTGVQVPPFVDMGCYEVQLFDCNGNGVTDFADIAGGVSLDCNGNSIPDECEPDCNGNGKPDDCDVADGTSPDENDDGKPDECVPFAVWYVDADATGAGDGTSWADAFGELQEALASAQTDDQVWVAEGVYRPDWDPVAGAYTFDRAAAFVPRPRVSMFGGFAGGETSLAQADPATYETILTGDLLGDDGPGFTNRGDNSNNVVRTDVKYAKFTFAGFTVRGGSTASLVSSFAAYSGGGLFIESSSDATVRDCVFESNSAYSGGGVADRGDSTFLRCRFERNRAGGGGGGITTGGVVVACTIVRNSGKWGGGVLREGTGRIVDCVIERNRAVDGGGIWSSSASTGSAIVASTIARNLASSSGAGIATSTWVYSLQIENCILWENRVGGVADEDAQLAPTVATVRRCDIQGLVPGGAFDDGTNFDADPLFVDIAAGDLRLGPGSPCIDRGDDAALPPDEADLDGDGDTSEPVPLDHSGAPREVDDPATPDTGSGTPPIVDVGAEEYQPTPGAER